MEPLIADIKADLELIEQEVASIERKLERLSLEKDPENIDSHVKAIAGSLHSVYTGYENVLERIIRSIDGDLPAGKDYHLMLLKRAINPLEGIRPPIISAKTFQVLDDLRVYRHRFRNIYLYMLSPERIIELARLGTRSLQLFRQDMKAFTGFLLGSH